MKQNEGLKKAVNKMIMAFIVLTSLMILLLFYSRFWETKRLEVKEYRIVNENFKGSLHGYKIVQLSDIHYGKSTFQEDLEKVIEKINLIKPNLLLFTGDLIDKDTGVTEKMVEEITTTLSKLDRSILRYSIKGEDDVKVNQYEFIMENTGFISLDYRYDVLPLTQEENVLLVGLSTNKVEEENILEEVNAYLEEQKENPPMYSILLIHEPDRVEELDLSNYSLILAGHSHGGQVKLPFIGGVHYPKYARNYHNDYQEMDGKDFYISSGIGTTTYAFRFLNPPSFNLYRMVSY